MQFIVEAFSAIDVKYLGIALRGTSNRHEEINLSSFCLTKIKIEQKQNCLKCFLTLACWQAGFSYLLYQDKR